VPQGDQGDRIAVTKQQNGGCLLAVMAVVVIVMVGYIVWAGTK
jgi:hypothetical protein